MKTTPFATAGEAWTTSLVANFHCSTPFFASTAYTLPSPLPKYTLPFATAGDDVYTSHGIGNRLCGWRIPVQALRLELAFVLDREHPLRLSVSRVDRSQRARRGHEIHGSVGDGRRRRDRHARLEVPLFLPRSRVDRVQVPAHAADVDHAVRDRGRRHDRSRRLECPFHVRGPCGTRVRVDARARDVTMKGPLCRCGTTWANDRHASAAMRDIETPRFWLCRPGPRVPTLHTIDLRAGDRPARRHGSSPGCNASAQARPLRATSRRTAPVSARHDRDRQRIAQPPTIAGRVLRRTA